MAKCLISVIVPCYNQAQFLNNSLTSVYSQSYSFWECIIVNDGSTDHTEDEALKWCSLDDRFKYIKKENGGLSSARNKGLELVTGKYIQFLDADDTIHAEKFSASIELANSEESNLIISNFNSIKASNNEILPPYCLLSTSLFNLEDILQKWDNEFTIPIHCGIFSANLFKDFKFDTELAAKEDWLMWIAIFKQNPKVHYIDIPYAFYWQHEKNMTSNKSMMNENTAKALISIYKNLENDYKTLFFKRVVHDLALRHKEMETLLHSTIYRTSSKIAKFVGRFTS